jgi:hypothetical protein
MRADAQRNHDAILAAAKVPLRQDLTPTQLLSMVSALPKDAGTGRTVEPCLRVVLDGLRA